jgi:hypothetical protein
MAGLVPPTRAEAEIAPERKAASAGEGPAIHALIGGKKDVDARVKPAHDALR